MILVWTRMSIQLVFITFIFVSWLDHYNLWYTISLISNVCCSMLPNTSMLESWQRPLNSGWNILLTSLATYLVVCSWQSLWRCKQSKYRHTTWREEAKASTIKGFVYGPQGCPCVNVVPIRGWPRIGTNLHWNKLYWIIGRLLHVIFLLVETWPVKVTTRGHSGLRNIKDHSYSY